MLSPTVSPHRDVSFSHSASSGRGTETDAVFRHYEEVKEATDWSATMVPVIKKIRNPDDLTKLNKAVKWEKFIIPTLDDIASNLSGATVFFSVNARSGFWQIPLDASSRRLTTFHTPFLFSAACTHDICARNISREDEHPLERSRRHCGGDGQYPDFR